MPFFNKLSVVLLVLPTFLIAQELPNYQVDAAWPQPLPYDFILGQVAGVATDKHDNVWLIQRPKSLAPSEMGLLLDPPLGNCCRPAPAVIQFNSKGEFLQAWGGYHWDEDEQTWRAPAVPWPETEHGIYIDAEDNVWIAGNGENDHSVLKFDNKGEHLLTLGATGGAGGSNDIAQLGRPADMVVDSEAREVYIADGYTNHRVIVFDSETGAYKRHWGAYGEPPTDEAIAAYEPDQGSQTAFQGAVHSIVLSNDGLLYVADRGNDRIQVFSKDGSFIREAYIAPSTLGNGSVWDITFSEDEEQRWLFVADGQNMKVWIVEREKLVILDSFGRGGRQAGQFDWLHNIAVDTQGNLYTGEVNNGRRIQKFSLQQP